MHALAKVASCRRLVAFVLMALVAGCAAAPTPLRVVSWNIHHGRGLDGVVDVERIARELATLAPDVVFLQEVDVGVRRSGRIDLAAELARRLGMHHAFGKNLDYQGGDYGNALLSRVPLQAVHNRHYRMLREGEQRGLLQAQVRHDGELVHLWCTHIDYREDDTERRANTAEILSWLADCEGDVVLAGDFNDLPGRDVHKQLTTRFVDAFAASGADAAGSYPAEVPSKRIDWVLVRIGAGLRPVAARVAPTGASDHCPVLVELLRR